MFYANAQDVAVRRIVCGCLLLMLSVCCHLKCIYVVLIYFVFTRAAQWGISTVDLFKVITCDAYV